MNSENNWAYETKCLTCILKHLICLLDSLSENLYLFCRYFKGDIQIASVDGYGTDVYVYLQSLSHMAQVCRYLSIISKIL